MVRGSSLRRKSQRGGRASIHACIIIESRKLYEFNLFLGLLALGVFIVLVVLLQVKVKRAKIGIRPKCGGAE